MRARVPGLLLLLLALASSGQAQDRRVTPLDRLLPEIRHTTPGTFYDAEGPYPGPDGQLRYRLKWMTPEGRIVWFDVNAYNGRRMNGVVAAPPMRPGGFPAARPWPGGGRGGGLGGGRGGERGGGRGERRGPH
jgi:hypothetical protein